MIPSKVLPVPLWFAGFLDDLDHTLLGPSNQAVVERLGRDGQVGAAAGAKLGQWQPWVGLLRDDRAEGGEGVLLGTAAGAVAGAGALGGAEAIVALERASQANPSASVRRSRRCLSRSNPWSCCLRA